MQHLFLTSSIGIKGVGESIRTHLGHDKKLKTAFIITPVEGDSDQSDLTWVQEDRDGLNNNGFVTFDYSITNKTLAEIKQDLTAIDVLYISGGNEFYMKAKSNLAQFDMFVHDFVARGGLYIGTSCGSVIAGKTMRSSLKLNDLSQLTSPIDSTGYGLVNFGILPHWGSRDFQGGWLSQETFTNMYHDDIPLIALNKHEYIEVVEDDYTIVDVRSES